MAAGPRHMRFSGVVPIDRLEREPVLIVGCGAIGAQIAKQLATMGVLLFHLYDDDFVEDVNLGTQGWRTSDLGSLKTEALANALVDINPNVRTIPGGRWSKDLGIPEGVSVIFSCADSMAVRKELFECFEALETQNKVFFDGRMGALVCDVYCVPTAKIAAYKQSLFDDAQAFEANCTSQSTFFAAGFASSLMSASYASYLRGGDSPFRTSANLGARFDFETSETFD